MGRKSREKAARREGRSVAHGPRQPGVPPPPPTTIAEHPERVPQMERELLEGVERVWCLHCERVWPVGQLRVTGRGEGAMVWCADPACDGAGPEIDLWDYDAKRREEPELAAHWPEAPAPGQAVPLYPE
jgi:hypothetical protein